MSSQEHFVEVGDAPTAPEAEVPEAAPSTPTVSTLRSYLSVVGSSPVAIVLAISAIFAPVVIIPYAFSDDYAILWMAIGGGPSIQFGKNVVDAGAISGRPFAGLLTQWFFRSEEHTSELQSHSF